MGEREVHPCYDPSGALNALIWLRRGSMSRSAGSRGCSPETLLLRFLTTLFEPMLLEVFG
jgi:hypothetical protein